MYSKNPSHEEIKEGDTGLDYRALFERERQEKEVKNVQIRFYIFHEL
jgi:hypothetical protein